MKTNVDVSGAVSGAVDLAVYWSVNGAVFWPVTSAIRQTSRFDPPHTALNKFLTSDQEAP